MSQELCRTLLPAQGLAGLSISYLAESAAYKEVVNNAECRDILQLLGHKIVVGTVIVFDELVNYEVSPLECLTPPQGST